MSISVHPWKLTWNLKNSQFKRKIIWTRPPWLWVQNVNFPSCICHPNKFTKLNSFGLPRWGLSQSVKRWAQWFLNRKKSPFFGAKKLTSRHFFRQCVNTCKYIYAHTRSLTAPPKKKIDSWKMILSFWDSKFSEASCWTSREYIFIYLYACIFCRGCTWNLLMALVLIGKDLVWQGETALK